MTRVLLALATITGEQRIKKLGYFYNDERDS